MVLQLPNIFNISYVNYMPLQRDQCFVNEFQCDRQSFDVDCTMMEIKAFTKNGVPQTLLGRENKMMMDPGAITIMQ